MTSPASVPEPLDEVAPAPSRPRGRRLVLWSPVALLVAFQYYLSAQSSLPSIPLPGRHADKVLHLAYFFLIATFVVRAARFGEGWNRHTTARAVVLGAMAWGFLDELHQSFTPQRFVEFGDVIADVTGAALALLVTEPFWTWLDRRVNEPGVNKGKVAGGQGVEPQ